MCGNGDGDGGVGCEGVRVVRRDLNCLARDIGKMDIAMQYSPPVISYLSTSTHRV